MAIQSINIYSYSIAHKYWYIIDIRDLPIPKKETDTDTLFLLKPIRIMIHQIIYIYIHNIYIAILYLATKISNIYEQFLSICCNVMI